MAKNKKSTKGGMEQKAAKISNEPVIIGLDFSESYAQELEGFRNQPLTKEDIAALRKALKPTLWQRLKGAFSRK